MKKTIGIIVCIMLCLSGMFWILAVREELEVKTRKKMAELRAKKMQDNYDEAITRINGSKKVKMVKW